jgi:transposase
MSLRFKTDLRVFVFSEEVDLRAGFDRLTSIVREKMNARLVDGDLFVFFGRSRTKVKMICYDGTGVVLINKRLERGKFMSLVDLEEREITQEELDILLRGGIVRRPKFGHIPLTKLPRGFEVIAENDRPQ